MSYEKIERLGGVQWPCPDEESEGTLFLHAPAVGGRPGQARRARPVLPGGAGRPARHAHRRVPDQAHHRPPPRLLQHRRGEQPVHHPAAAEGDAEPVAGGRGATWASPTTRSPAISSRRGSITAPVRVDGTLREGLAFMTLHFPDQVETNILTLDTWDPKSGTAEFKATAIRVEKASPEEAAAFRSAATSRGGDQLVDLRLTAKVAATDEERAAVDGVLGPPPSGWEGGARRAEDAHVAFGGHAARARRHLLITVLHAVQERVGWISPGALDYVCRAARRSRLPRRTASRRSTPCSAPRPSPGAVVHVCDDVACKVAGAEELCAEMTRRFGREGTERAALERHRRHLAALPVPRQVRPRLGRADPAGGRGGAQAGLRAGHARRGLAGAHDRRVPGRGPPRGAGTAAIRHHPERTRAPRHRGPRLRPGRRTRSRCCAASARSTPRPSAPTGRRAATRCCAARSPSAPRASSARSATPS